MKKISRKARKLTNAIARFATSRSLTLAGDDARALRFFQFKAATADYFYREFGLTDVRIDDTPHFALAKALADGAGIDAAERSYRDYLLASWGEGAVEKMSERIKVFKTHFTAIAAGDRMPRIALTQFLPNRPHVVLDGNHRASMSAALGKPITAEVLRPDIAIRTYSNAPEFYGTGNGGLPYQSIFLDGQEVVHGRRDDALERLDLIPKEILSNRRVLDIASNIGMSTKLAYKMGASYCKGLEISGGMVDLAVKFAIFDGVYPHTEFTKFDIDTDDLPKDEVYDVAFAFSIHDHLKRPERLAEIVKKHVRGSVIFEGHPGHSEDRYKSFFESGLFAAPRLLGTLAESTAKSVRNRNLWLLERR